MTRVTVDGQEFLVEPDPGRPGVVHFRWLAGTPDYGFTTSRSDRRTLSGPEIEAAIRDFLAQVDPATGYIGD